MTQQKTARVRIKQLYRTMSPKEKLIADYVLKDSSEFSRKSISDISYELGVADSTIFQFAKKLGYEGFSDFKITLVAEESDFKSTVHENVLRSDDLESVINKVFDSANQTILDTKRMSDIREYKKSVDILLQSERLFLFGVGGSNAVAMDAYHKFLRSPIFPIYSTDAHIQLMNASLITKNDCAIIICHSGLTIDIINMAELIKENGARIISITSYPISPLGDLSDVILTTYSEETNYRSESLASRISQLAIIDALFVALSLKNEKKSLASLKKIRKAIATTKLKT
ncbi:MAG TPA: MurR/RpiR family transcriptional regulator [Erysipelotrichaceae bacterium]|nr:MurR/RpiR family transcriptional regulator [Erysipelotrichaceae bacterium]HQB31994.1 MurR/RpiR family transcriptional regulator [Erysipelotrichaceae bacterium]